VDKRRRRDLSFKIREFAYLKVFPMRVTRRFKVKGKLAPRYVEPFKIIDRKGEVAYQLKLPHSCYTYMMYFMYHSSRSAYEYQKNNCQWKSLT
jgi:hypothetical protein